MSDAHTCCPACGQGLPEGAGFPIEALQHLALTKQQRAIVAHLASIWPLHCNRQQLADALFSGREGYRTEHFFTQISVQISKARPVLEAVGWTIPKNSNATGMRGRYRLERLGEGEAA